MGRRLSRRVALALCAGLVLGLTQAHLTPSPAVAAPALEPLPETGSTSVSESTMRPVAEDDAGKAAVSGNQPDTEAPDGAGMPTATPLSPSATWNVSAQTGDFHWSYPLRVPPAPGGLEPDLALSYASSAVDGRTSSTNNQASWVGDGWDLNPGFIERTYGACLSDKEGDTTPPRVGDLCWRSHNATAVYSGMGGVLVRDDDTGEWRNRGDDGSRIERLTGSNNGAKDGEYWKITTVDGLQYYFGSRAASSSTWTVPVYGDDSGEPCHADTFAASACDQAWRWNLDKIVDRNGNLVVYTYAEETNRYGQNMKDASVEYTRGGHLHRVEYGLREGVAGQASGRIDFDVTSRCLANSTCDLQHKGNWPDVPLGARCDQSTCPDRHSPTFWTTKRLSTITARVRRGSEFAAVDSWALSHIHPDPGDGEKAALWLRSIQHTGHVGTAQSLPKVTFEGKKFANRVERVDGAGPLNRYRLVGIVSETGGQLSVVYAPPDCSATSLPSSAQNNTRRCFPMRWQRRDFSERTDHFHKYVVESVTTGDRMHNGTVANAEQRVAYEYLGGAAWRYDTSEFTENGKRTWNEFRGFGRVRIRSGDAHDPAGPVGMTELRFHRGMHGDREAPSGGTKHVTVTDSEQNERLDHDWLSGMEVESTTYDGTSGPAVTKTLTWPTWQGPTASRGDLDAYIVRPGTVRTYTALATGGWRATRTVTEYDDRGLPVEVNDSGDVATTADDLCTRTTYVRNTERWLLALPSRVETVAVSCDGTAEFPADAVSDVRTSYDGRAHGTAPTEGNATTVDALDQRPAAGPVYYNQSRHIYDTHGRVRTSTDDQGRTTTTSYTPSAGGPLTQTVVSNALGHTTTTTVEPAWGSPLTTVDANARRTENRYDSLGRVTDAWLPNRNRAAEESPNARFTYTVSRDAPTVVTAQRLGPNGNYLTTKTLYDGLYRVRQTQTPAIGGGRLLTDVRYDSQGRQYRTTKPFFNDAPIDDRIWVAADNQVHDMTVVTFDGAGRQTTAVAMSSGVEKWRTSTTHGGDRTSITPPAGGTATTSVTDARGRTTELRQYHDTRPTGTYDTTKYTYTAAGDLATVTNPAGTVWRYEHDLRGRQKAAHDPDRGTSTTTFDAKGRMASTTDARGQQLSYTYDDLGRRTAVRSGNATGPLLAEWSHDVAIGGKGQLAATTRWVNGQAYVRRVHQYSALYKPLRTSVVIPEAEVQLANTYVTSTAYNLDGSVASTTLPAAGGLPQETVLITYNDHGLPLKTSGGLGGGTDTYVNGTMHTRFGEVERIELGEPDLRNRTWLTYFYDDHTRRLERSMVDAEVYRPVLADRHYRYDPAGNILEIADRPVDQQADVQCLRYDHLRRLTEAWTPDAGCAAEPTVEDLAGPAPYWHTYGYDTAGNRTAERLRDPDHDVTRTYTYPAPTAPRPHSLTSVTSAGAQVAAYAYDAAGNTTTRTTDDTQTLAWDPEGRLAAATTGDETTTNIYDADGQRLVRRDPAGTTVFLSDGHQLRLRAGTSQVTATRYYSHAGQVIAMRTPDRLTWLANDHQATAGIAITPANWTITHRRQTPFGGERGPTGTAFPGERGFVGGTMDRSTELVSIGARHYDPETGRFISVDPIMDLSDPQQMQGYAYANNSPVTRSDPSGMLSIGGSVSDLLDDWSNTSSASSGGWYGSYLGTRPARKNPSGIGSLLGLKPAKCPELTCSGKAGNWFKGLFSALDGKLSKTRHCLSNLPGVCLDTNSPEFRQATAPPPRPKYSVSGCVNVSASLIFGSSGEVCVSGDSEGLAVNSAVKNFVTFGAGVKVGASVKLSSVPADAVNKGDSEYISASGMVGLGPQLSGGGSCSRNVDSGAKSCSVDVSAGFGYGLTFGEMGEAHGSNSGYITRWGPAENAIMEGSNYVLDGSLFAYLEGRIRDVFG